MIQAEMDLVNMLLPGASPIGAYCMGILTFRAWNKFRMTEEMLTQARACESIRELLPHIQEWEKQAKRAAAKKKAGKK